MRDVRAFLWNAIDKGGAPLYFDKGIQAVVHVISRDCYIIEVRVSMNMGFEEKDIKKIAEALGATYQKTGSMFRIKVTAEQRELSLEIHPGMLIGDTTGDLISIYTPTAHLQLHFCSGYVISESLGEVTFVGEYGGRLSGLIVEQGAGCSLFANVDRKLLSGDFTRLGPEVMLTGLALSLTEEILPDQLTDIQ